MGEVVYSSEAGTEDTAAKEAVSEAERGSRVVD
jgi:hypothetical protein